MRSQADTEVELKIELETLREQLTDFDQILEERDAWKSSTRRLENSLIEISTKNRALEEAIIRLERQERKKYSSKKKFESIQTSDQYREERSESFSEENPLAQLKHLIDLQDEKNYTPSLDFSRFGCPNCCENIVQIV